MTWEPIETAPQDGSRILLFQSKDERYAEWLGVGWCDSGIWLDQSGRLYLYPDAWMPLPDPPSDDHRKARK